ncbi:hypothetical protein [Streptomyces sp. NPDC001568]|uniref:hypothetical protein n=1 Tax=Streptomyces sp. NPDC001568 TaxID=3364588 RepID=UPI00369B6A42
MTDTTPNAMPPGGPGGPYGHGFIPGQPQTWGSGPNPAPGRGYPAPHPGPGWGNGPQAFNEWRSVGEIAQSMPGCVSGFVLLVPGTIPLLILYSLARSARSRAHRVFRLQREPVLDHPLSRVKKARAVLAVLTSAVFLLAYGAQKDFEDALTGGAVRLLVAPWLLVLSAPLLVYLLMRWASVNEHARMKAQLRVPLITVAKYVSALTVVPLLALAATPVMNSLVDHPYIAFGLGIAVLALMLWAAAFTVFSSSLVVRAGFGTGQVHKALPGLLTALLMWEFVPVGVLVSGMPPGPVPLALLFLLGGPLTVTAVTWWEVHRLTTRHGVVLRP